MNKWKYIYGNDSTTTKSDAGTSTAAYNGTLTLLTFSSSAKHKGVSRWDEMDLAKVHESGCNLAVIQGNLYNCVLSS